jgi:putative cell wall-binding protein
VLKPGGIVYLLGGPQALSPTVEAAFLAAGLRVERVFGLDRYETAVAIARRVAVAPMDVLIVSGTSFADAMVAGPVAGELGAPVLLSSPSGLTPSTQAYLATLPLAERVIIGGTAAVGDITASQAGTADRVAGADRYETAVRVAERWMPEAMRLSFATGASFQDALAGAAWSAHESMPLVLLAPVPGAATRTYVKSVVERLESASVYGGTGALSDTTVALAFV